MIDPATKHRPDLYTRDFYAWSRQQALALAERQDAALDTVNLLDEIESVGGSQRSAIDSRLEVLIAHLLKFRTQPERITPSWRLTLKEQRRALARLVDRNPSLRRYPAEILGDVYRHAVRSAARETFLDEDRFPETNPFTLDQILDPDFEP